MSEYDAANDPESSDPLEWVMDRLIFGPYGAFTELTLDPAAAAESGRRRLEQQFRNARFLGEMTLTHGSREIKRRVGDLLSGGRHVSPPSAAGPDSAATEEGVVATPRPARITPDPIDHILAGYDDLSASQVVKLLDSLSTDELRSVVTYEEASRGRRTILTRAGQLIARG